MRGRPVPRANVVEEWSAADFAKLKLDELKTQIDVDSALHATQKFYEIAALFGDEQQPGPTRLQLVQAPLPHRGRLDPSTCPPSRSAPCSRSNRASEGRRAWPDYTTALL